MKPRKNARTESLQSHFDNLQNNNERKYQTGFNGQLSQAGKYQAVKKLSADRAPMIAAAVADFQREYKSLRQAFESNSRARAAAQEAADKRWEPLRFTIERQTAIAARSIRLNTPENELLETFRSVRDSGAYVVAWFDAMTQSPKDMIGKGVLLSEIKAAYEKFENTPEMDAVNLRGEKLAQRALDLQEDTINFMGLLAQEDDYTGAARDLQIELDRLKISRKHGHGMNMIVTVRFEDSNADQLGGLVIADALPAIVAQSL